VPHGMAQFVLKIEKLSHIMGTTPILEMARAYGLRPRLWLLIEMCFNLVDFEHFLAHLHAYFKGKNTPYRRKERVRINLRFLSRVLVLTIDIVYARYPKGNWK